MKFNHQLFNFNVLHSAAMQNKIDFVEALLGSNKIDVNYPYKIINKWI